EPLPGKPDYPIAAVPHNTAPDATSPWAMPGQYTVVLTAGGKSYTRPLTVQMDPRVKTPVAELAQQFRWSYAIYEDLRSYLPVAEAVASGRDQGAAHKQKAADKPEALAALAALQQKLEPLGGSGPPTLPGVPRPAPLTFATITGRLGQLFGVLQEVDAAPTAQTVANINELRGLLPPLIAKWKSVTATD